METYAHATVDLLMTPERLADIPNGARIADCCCRRIANIYEAEAHQMRTHTLRLLTHQALDTSRPPRTPGSDRGRRVRLVHHPGAAPPDGGSVCRPLARGGPPRRSHGHPLGWLRSFSHG